MIFFTADLHFNHDKIISYCNRPFDSVEEMNQVLIERWNSKIADTDEVYIVGDFAFGDPTYFFNALKGKKHFILGSHDDLSEANEKQLESVSKYKEIKFEKRTFILSHCPLRCWEHGQSGAIHLFGHVHGRIKTYNLSMDVGVDTNNYFPYSLPEILVKMDIRKQEMKENYRIALKNNTEVYYQDDVRWFEHVINAFRENVSSVKVGR